MHAAFTKLNPLLRNSATLNPNQTDICSWNETFLVRCSLLAVIVVKNYVSLAHIMWVSKLLTFVRLYNTLILHISTNDSLLYNKCYVS